MSREVIGYSILALVPVFMGLSLWFGLQYKAETAQKKSTPDPDGWVKAVRTLSKTPLAPPKPPLVVNRAYTPFSKMVDGKLLWGYLITKNGVTTTLVAPKFDEAQPFYGHQNEQYLKKYKAFLADPKKTKEPHFIDFFKRRVDGTLFAIASLNGKKGLLGWDGKFRLPNRFDTMERSPNERLIIFAADKKYGTASFFNFSRSHFQRFYDNITPMVVYGSHTRQNAPRHEQTLIYYKVRKDGKFNYLDSEGNNLFIYHYRYFDKLFPVHAATGRAIVQKGEKFYIASTKVKQLVSLPFDEIEASYDMTSFFARRKNTDNGLFGLYSLTGQVLAKPRFKAYNCLIKPEPSKERLRKSNDALFTVQIGDKWGILSKYGHLLTKPIYDKIDCFQKDQYHTKAYLNGVASTICFDGSTIANSKTSPSLKALFKTDNIGSFQCKMRWRKKYSHQERKPSKKRFDLAP